MSENANEKSKVNKGMYVIGVASILGILLYLIPVILFMVSIVNYISQATIPGRGLAYYYVPHLLVILVFGIAMIIMAIGGFGRNNVLCLIATGLYGVDFVVARLADYFTHVIISSDYMKYSNNPITLISSILTNGLRNIYFKKSCFVGTVFFTIGLLLVAVVLVIKCTKAKGGAVRIIGTIIAGLSTFILGITSLIDIIMLNVVNARTISLTDKIPYITLFMEGIRNFFRAPYNWKYLIELEPMFFIILDLQLFVMFAIVAITSAVTITGKKD